MGWELPRRTGTILQRHPSILPQSQLPPPRLRLFKRGTSVPYAILGAQSRRNNQLAARKMLALARGAWELPQCCLRSRIEFHAIPDIP